MGMTKARRRAAASRRPPTPLETAKMQEVGALCLTALLPLLDDAGASSMVIGAEDDANGEHCLLIVGRGPSALLALVGVLRAGLDRLPPDGRAVLLSDIARRTSTH